MTASDIRGLSARRNIRIARREFDEMVEEFYAPDARLLPSGEVSRQGIDAIRIFWREAPSRGLVDLTLDPREVVASGDLGYEVGSFSRTLRPRHGAPFQERGKYLVVYRHEDDGSWRAVAEMFNSDDRR